MSEWRNLRLTCDDVSYLKPTRKYLMYLEFRQGGPTKWYAKTPMGEYAFSTSDGALYEWRGNNRYDYVGREARATESDNEQISWTDWVNRREIEPKMRGTIHALNSYLGTYN